MLLVPFTSCISERMWKLQACTTVHCLDCAPRRFPHSPKRQRGDGFNWPNRPRADAWGYVAAAEYGQSIPFAACRYVLLSFEFFARRDDLWGSPLGCGRPLRPACPRAGICEGCEHAGLGGRRSPRGCPTRLFTSRWRPRHSSSSPPFAACRYAGQVCNLNVTYLL